MTSTKVESFHRTREGREAAEARIASHGGGGYDGGDMEQRVAKLEVLTEGLDKRLDRIESKLLTKWDMAQVVFYVVGGLMAAAIFGPRLVSIISATP